jgi:hypothetical protein
MFGSFLFPDDLLDLTDLFLDFAGSSFIFAFGFQAGVHPKFSGDLPDFPSNLMPLAFCLVPRA